MRLTLPADPRLAATLATRDAGLIVVPCKPQPPEDHPFIQDCSPAGYCWNDSEADLDDISFWPAYNEFILPPFKPGDVVGVREPWLELLSFDFFDDDVPETVPTFWFQADPLPTWGEWKKRPASTLPRDYIRTHITVASVECRRVNTITDKEAFEAGLQEWVDEHRGSTGDGSARGAFKAMYESTKGRSFAADWAWFIAWKA